MNTRDVEAEAEAGGASGGRKFLESLEAEASEMEARRRLRLRKIFESLIFQPKKYLKCPYFEFSTFLLFLLSSEHAPECRSIKSVKVSVRDYFLVLKHSICTKMTSCDFGQKEPC